MADDRFDIAPPEIDSLFRLDERIALVTGAATGIGRTAAWVLARAGATVIATDLDGGGAEDTTEAIRAEGLDAHAHKLDVSDEASVTGVFDAVRRSQGPVTILVNNAGISIKAPTEALSLADWQRVVNVNLTGVFLCARAAAGHMLPERDGSIINISSMWGHVAGGFSGNVSYHATKGAVVMLTKALAVEWGRHGIRVNDIAPTFLRTHLTEALFADEDLHRMLEQTTPLGRTGQPNDLAGALLFLASSSSALVTGHSLLVDGGWTAR